VINKNIIAAAIVVGTLTAAVGVTIFVQTKKPRRVQFTSQQ
jgi:hypothetical protein